MAQMQKLEAQVNVQCCAQTLFEKFTSKRNEMPKICSDKVAYTDAQPGDWKCAEASVRRWDLVIDGKSQYMTEKISVDEENKTVCYTILDGDVMKNSCKKLDMKVQIVPMGEGHCSAKWTFEFEKLNEGAPAPLKELEYVLNLTKDAAKA